MRKVCFAFLLVFSATASYAQNSSRVVKWESIVGVMTAPNVDNPVAGISSGTLPWWTKGGRARVDLFTGAVSFNVQGLVLIGASPTGTAGPVTDVTGTLVCNPNDSAPIVIDSP